MEIQNYFYLNVKRIQSLFSQLERGTLTHFSEEESSKTSASNKKQIGLKLSLPYIAEINSEMGIAKIRETDYDAANHYRIETENMLREIQRRLVHNIRELIVNNSDDSNIQSTLVSYDETFYTHGLKRPQSYESEKWDGTLPYIHTKIDDTKLVIRYHPSNFTSKSSWGYLSDGRRRFAGAGLIDKFGNNEVTLVPLSIGMPRTQLMKDLGL